VVRTVKRVPLIVAVVAGACLISDPAGATMPITTRVSVGNLGESNGASSIDAKKAVSAEGQFVVFTSDASNLVSGDTNGTSDIFIRDRSAGTTARVSVNSAGQQADGLSQGASVSSGGRYVVFESLATNLVPNDANGLGDVFVRDRQTHTTSRVSVGTGGGEGNGPSSDATISGGGRYVVFVSTASNLVSGDTNGSADVFVRDRQTHTTSRVSVGPKGVQGNGPSSAPVISGDGDIVAFDSSATNLVRGDTNGFDDVFVRHRTAHTTTRPSRSSTGQQSDAAANFPCVSSDGRYVGFESGATNLINGDTNSSSDIFVRDQQLRRTARVSVPNGGGQANGPSRTCAISGDGRFVVFVSGATNLIVANDTNGDDDVFRRDRRIHGTNRVSIGTGGIEGDGASLAGSISASGRFVVFQSEATNIVSGDTNNQQDVFVRGPLD
jgi:hypothetical protein